MRRLIVDLTISAEEYLKLYQGSARTVRACSRDGRTVHFPAKILVPFVEQQGIQGSFIISYDEHSRFQQIRRL